MCWRRKIQPLNQRGKIVTVERGGLAWSHNMKQPSFPRIITQKAMDFLWKQGAGREDRNKGWCKRKRAELRKARDWYSQIQLCRYKMWNNQGSFYSRVNISKTNHPWYAYQIPFADIVLCNTALWVEYHKDYMGSSCSLSYFALHLSHFHSLSVLWSPNIIQHNGISTESLYCALDTHIHTRWSPFSMLNGNQCASNVKGH